MLEILLKKKMLKTFFFLNSVISKESLEVSFTIFHLKMIELKIQWNDWDL